MRKNAKVKLLARTEDGKYVMNKEGTKPELFDNSAQISKKFKNKKITTQAASARLVRRINRTEFTEGMITVMNKTDLKVKLNSRSNWPSAIKVEKPVIAEIITDSKVTPKAD